MGLRSNIVRAIMSMVGPSRGFGIAGGVRRKSLTSQLSRFTNNKVQTGPFQGMVLPDITSWGDGDRAPKLLGTYEADLFPAIADLVARAPQQVINVGCAEGYYAVGLARLLPTAAILAFDIDIAAQRLCATAAALNGNNVQVSGLCTPATLNGLLNSTIPTLIVMDCEGGEAELLDPIAVPGLANADILVESHDCITPGLKEDLAARFAPTHTVELIRQGPRNPHALNLFPGLTERDRWLMVDENRPEPMYWLVCRADRQSAHCQSAE